jgi:hypothetical protein
MLLDDEGHIDNLESVLTELLEFVVQKQQNCLSVA